MTAIWRIQAENEMVREEPAAEAKEEPKQELPLQKR